MTHLRRMMAVAALATAAGATTTLAAAAAPTLENPGAESELAGSAWTQNAGYVRSAYGSDERLPSAQLAGSFAAGSFAFSSSTDQADAALTQQVPVDPDEPDTTYFAGGLFGGTGATTSTARLEATPLSADGTALAQPTRIGGPSAADRSNLTTFVRCDAGISVPHGTSSLRLSLIGTANGGGLAYADSLTLSQTATITPSTGAATDGIGCSRPLVASSPPATTPSPPVTTSTPPATPTSTPSAPTSKLAVQRVVTLSANNRCRPGGVIRLKLRSDAQAFTTLTTQLAGRRTRWTKTRLSSPARFKFSGARATLRVAVFRGASRSVLTRTYRRCR